MLAAILTQAFRVDALLCRCSYPYMETAPIQQRVMLIVEDSGILLFKPIRIMNLLLPKG